jgi:hypothetical protein
MSKAGRLSPAARARLAVRIWHRYTAVRLRVRRKPLPELVQALRRPGRTGTQHYEPARLSHAVDRALRLGRRRPTCLVNSLVLFRLLREQGDAAELVIGLPPESGDQTAHAWVEIDGDDIGPPPGRGRHAPLARFG